jgi:hypothetical protein
MKLLVIRMAHTYHRRQRLIYSLTLKHDLQSPSYQDHSLINLISATRPIQQQTCSTHPISIISLTLLPSYAMQQNHCRCVGPYRD